MMAEGSFGFHFVVIPALQRQNWSSLKELFSHSTVKPNICLSSDLRGEPQAKDKEKDLILCVGELFRRGLIYATNDWPGGPL